MEKLSIPPDQAGYTVTDGNEVISVQLDGGLPRSRRDILGAASRVTTTWTLGPNEFQYFRAFFRVISVKAAQPFLIDLLLDLPTLTEHVCKIVPGTMRFAENDGQKFVVSCEIDALPNTIEDDEFALSLVTVIQIYGNEWPDFYNELEQLLNVQLPEKLARLMSEYTEFFLNSLSSVVQLETLEISHPNFTKTYRVVRNATNGVRVVLETLEYADFEYYPLKITGTGTRENLDYGFKIDFGDLGEIIPQEVDEVSSADAFHIKPLIVYRTYRSDDLGKPLFGPLVLEVGNFAFKREGASFEAKAPSLNINKTGEIYSLDRFPMLRGLL